MSESTHVFKLKLPNGAEVHIEGEKEFVTAGYADIRAAAVTLFNREASRTSREEAMTRLLHDDGAPMRAMAAAQLTETQPPAHTPQATKPSVDRSKKARSRNNAARNDAKA